jgi:aryl-alcohol dehydrogenase-like predicted oxidoreductase
MSLSRQPLPQTDLEVSPLCLGAGGFGTGIHGAAAERLVGDFLAAGGNFFDTAHCYAFWQENGLGASERELGATLRRLGALDTAVVATKGGHPDMGPDYRRPADFLAPRVIAADLDDSLERLGIDCIPLYYLHRDDGMTPVAEIIETLNAEVARGRVRYLGASNWSVARLAAANEYAARRGFQGFAASQVQWSLAEPNWRPTTDPTTRYVTDEESRWHTAAGVPLVAYSATASGYFAGRGHAAGNYANAANAARFDRAVELAARLGSTPSQVALAYLMHQPPRVIPLFSTGDPAHLAEALAATRLALSSAQARWLRDGGDPV